MPGVSVCFWAPENWKKRSVKLRKEGAAGHETTELQLRRMESELRALLTEDPDDADVSKLLAQTTAALPVKSFESPIAWRRARPRAGDANAKVTQN